MRRGVTSTRNSSHEKGMEAEEALVQVGVPLEREMTDKEMEENLSSKKKRKHSFCQHAILESLLIQTRNSLRVTFTDSCALESQKQEVLQNDSLSCHSNHSRKDRRNIAEVYLTSNWSSQLSFV